MDTLITDPALSRRLIRKRRECGGDRYDEVWDGVYVMSPLASNEHQDLVGLIYIALQLSVGFAGLGGVLPGANVSDRTSKWRQNYRCPDVVAFLSGTSAINKGSHWLGGPDFAVEIVSQYDRSRQKLEFYAKVGVRELLLVDRYPWALELYRLKDGVLGLVGKSDLENPAIIASQVVPLTFQLVPGQERPRIDIRHTDGLQRWSA